MKKNWSFFVAFLLVFFCIPTALAGCDKYWQEEDESKHYCILEPGAHGEVEYAYRSKYGYHFVVTWYQTADGVRFKSAYEERCLEVPAYGYPASCESSG